MTESNDIAAWRRLGELLEARRKALGYPKRLPFARAHGLTHDRTLSDLENARRTSFEDATLAQVESIYQWERGSINRVLAGADPVELVGTGLEDGGVLLKLSPEAYEGLDPLDRQRAEAEATAAWLRVAQEARRRANEGHE